MSIYFQFRQVVDYSIILVLINTVVILCLCEIPLTQMAAWRDELKNLTNSTILIQYHPIEKSILGCIMVTCLILVFLSVSIAGFNEIIKFFRQITWKMWLFIVCFESVLLAILYPIILSEKALMLTKNLSKKIVFNTHMTGFYSSTPPHDGYLPLEIYYSTLCMLCVTVLCNIQHIIIIILIINIKPKNFDDVENNKCSKSSTAQNQETSKAEIV
jgi:hypothetical protein